MMRRLSPLAIFCLLALGCGDGGSSGGDGDGDGDGDCASGCVADDGSCAAGTSEAACGRDGLSCAVCQGEAMCVAGECVTDEPTGCGPDSCAGCCSGDSCLSGDAASACGSSGIDCVDCGSRGVCGSDGCEVDPMARWNLIAEDAMVPAENADGGAWDPMGGMPDVFVRAILDDEELLSSAVIGNSLAPVWNEAIATDITAAEAEALIIELVDDDGVGDDLIDRCVLGARSFEQFGGDAFAVTCNNGVGYTLTLRFEAN